jgi:hypothetical protein
MALVCQLPLRDFLTKLESYESTLGPFGNKTSFRTAHNKAKWALSMVEEVNKLRAFVAAKVMSINLLFATHTSQTLSKLESRTRNNYEELKMQFARNSDEVNQLREGLKSVETQISHTQQSSETRFDTLDAHAASAQTSLLSLRNIGSQILAFVSTFPVEIRDLLARIMQQNNRVYMILLSIQASTAVSPTSKLASNIKFEDVLGRNRELPYEYFQFWEVRMSLFQLTVVILTRLSALRGFSSSRI